METKELQKLMLPTQLGVAFEEETDDDKLQIAQAIDILAHFIGKYVKDKSIKRYASILLTTIKTILLF